MVFELSSELDIIYMTYCPDDDSESADRPATETEITPEMIQAGCLALYARENDEAWASPEERVSAIYRAMVAVR
jgi:hypothetical protein